MMCCEPLITICGKELSISQSMTIRVAIESFASDLMHNGLGDDDMGKKMVAGYMQRIEEIRALILGTVTTPSDTVTTLIDFRLESLQNGNDDKTDT